MSDSLVHINLFLDQLFQHGPLLVYVVLFFACLIENLFPPFPGDSFVAAAGALAAAGGDDLGYVNLCFRTQLRARFLPKKELQIFLRERCSPHGRATSKMGDAHHT
jgi:hypothetical protein